MTSILTVFLIALAFSLCLTPLARKLGQKLGAMDKPDKRKIHIHPIPRTGGLAIFTSFLVTLSISDLFTTTLTEQLVINRQVMFFLGGAVTVFGIGILDDFFSLGPKLKLGFQILAASLAYYGGIQISELTILGFHLNFGITGYFITVFWFVLFINAINLFDGLDGLAAGVSFFVSFIMIILMIMRQEYLIAMMFAALGGTILGFLRYNFNPASIFMGDSGSYFLGYTLAGLSIFGAFKSEISTALLIPILAMGVPLLDTILAPVRRFMLGRKIFNPDNAHIHHKLIGMGFSIRNAVLLIYAVSIGLCIASLLIVNMEDETGGFFLTIILLSAFFVIRRLGYIEYIDIDIFLAWVRGVSDEIGISHERRSFLNHQVEINDSSNLHTLWSNTVTALQRLGFETAKLHLNDHSGLNGKAPIELNWAHQNFDPNSSSENLLNIKIPLMDQNDINFGNLILVKDLTRAPINNLTLRRVELLRRTLISTLIKLKRAEEQVESCR